MGFRVIYRDGEGGFCQRKLQNNPPPPKMTLLAVGGLFCNSLQNTYHLFEQLVQPFWGALQKKIANTSCCSG